MSGKDGSSQRFLDEYEQILDGYEEFSVSVRKLIRDLNEGRLLEEYRKDLTKRAVKEAEKMKTKRVMKSKSQRKSDLGRYSEERYGGRIY